MAQETLNNAQRALLEADQRVSEASLDFEQATPARVMENFIQERVSSNDYTKRLGLLSLVRQDFKVLSDLIDEQNKKLVKGEISDTNQGYGINRIVLYIDDLDRCSEAKVVEVLQAVHLLLALPLFVVVVAVDARWIYRALSSHYPQLLQEPGSGEQLASASPLDYLEKIFQIPFWITPIDKQGRTNMLRSLFAGGDAAAGSSHSANGSDEEEVDLILEALKIEQAELDLIDDLVPLVGRSPRALKRFVNVYRLIKAGLSTEERQSFVTSPSPDTAADFSTVMFLLALVTNSPGVATSCFRAIEALGKEDEGLDATVQSPPPGATMPVTTLWDDLLSRMEADTSVAGTRDWEEVKSWVNDNGQDLLTDDRDRLRYWAHRVARFSFRAEPAWLN